MSAISVRCVAFACALVGWPLLLVARVTCCCCGCGCVVGVAYASVLLLGVVLFVVC